MKGTVIHRSPRLTQQQPPLCHVKLELSLLCAVFFPPLLVRRGAQILAAQWEVGTSCTKSPWSSPVPGSLTSASLTGRIGVSVQANWFDS